MFTLICDRIGSAATTAHPTRAGQAVVAAELAKSFARHADSRHGGQ
ncbi:hypothetical protein OHB26_31605 [Nocardia sp. NBC_01503]|nr:hypothetical protein [Nocardia sp. NBC_01503]WTL31417.1 hypothetical protein OHB26_31605 [Nocardia sp. NBC_01503]